MNFLIGKEFNPALKELEYSEKKVLEVNEVEKRHDPELRQDRFLSAKSRSLINA